MAEAAWEGHGRVLPGRAGGSACYQVARVGGRWSVWEGRGCSRDSRHTSSAFPAASRKAEGVWNAPRQKKGGGCGNGATMTATQLSGDLVRSPPPPSSRLHLPLLPPRTRARYAPCSHTSLSASAPPSLRSNRPASPADLLFRRAARGLPSLEAPLAAGRGAACRGLLPIRDASYCCRLALGPT